MRTLALIFFFMIHFFVGDKDISMLGLKINDPVSELDKIKLEVVASDKTGKTPMIKYRTENGNDLSVTSQKGKLVYIENDWLHDTKGNKPLISNFTFGETSLRDIRKAFGTNGFAHAERAPFTTDTDLIEFNCFELDSPNNEELVIVTKLRISDKITEDNVADSLKLEAIIIAQKDYMNGLWGKKKVYDKVYHKVKF